MFLWHTGSQERARACAERALEQAPGDAASLSLLGWILIHHPHANTESSSIEPEDLEQAAGLLEQVLLKQPRHTEVSCCCCSCMVQSCRVSPPPPTPPPSQNLNTNSYAVLLMHKAIRRIQWACKTSCRLTMCTGIPACTNQACYRHKGLFRRSAHACYDPADHTVTVVSCLSLNGCSGQNRWAVLQH